jgi:hypothetical protein
MFDEEIDHEDSYRVVKDCFVEGGFSVLVWDVHIGTYLLTLEIPPTTFFHENLKRLRTIRRPKFLAEIMQRSIFIIIFYRHINH